MGLRRTLLQLEQRRFEGPHAAYIHLGFSRFLYYYARGHYADAGVWSRRLAEAFCINVLHTKYTDQSSYPLLGGMLYDLPYSISWARVFDLCDDVTAMYLGCHFTVSTVWDDLQTMRAYGNNGVHAHSYFFDRPAADPSVFLATLRIVLASMEMQRKARL